MDLGDRGRRDRLAEVEKQRVERFPERLLDRRAPPPRAGTAACGPAALSRSRARSDPDDVGAGRQELADLDVGRSEPGQRRRESGRAAARVGSLDQAREAQPQPRRQAAARSDRPAPAPPRAPGRSPRGRLRARWTMSPSTSDLPARMDGDDAAGQRRVGDAPEAGAPDHGARSAAGGGKRRIDSTR